MKQIEAQKNKIEVLKQEISKLTGKIEELSKQIEEEKQELEKIKHDLASLLAKEVLGELPSSRKGAIEDQRKRLDEKELRLTSLALAKEELEGRLDQAREALRQELLKLFDLVRKDLLSRLDRDFETYNREALKLLALEEQINQTARFVRKWESLLQNHLRQVGLDPEEAGRKLHYFGTAQFLDNDLSYVDRGTGTPRVKPLAELIQTRKVNPPSFPNELAFTQVVPHQIDLPETDVWNWLERALNVE